MKIKDVIYYINFYSVLIGIKFKDMEFLGKLSIILLYI